MNNFITITELIYASWIFYSSLNANKFQILLRNIKIFFSILSFNFLIFCTLYQILFYYYFNRTISRICDFVSIQMPIKCTQKKVTNHVTECSKEEIIKTIEKKKKKLDKYKCLQTLYNSHSWIQHICHFLIHYS